MTQWRQHKHPRRPLLIMSKLKTQRKKLLLICHTETFSRKINISFLTRQTEDEKYTNFCFFFSISFEEPKSETCKICGKGFKNTHALNGHMRQHGGYTKPVSSLRISMYIPNAKRLHKPMHIAFVPAVLCH
jgi:hypothetical protein